TPQAGRRGATFASCSSNAMKTLLLIVLGTLAACRLDNLLHQPGGSPPPSASGSLKLAFTVQPSNATAGQAIAASVQVTAQDQNRPAATNLTGQVTLALGKTTAGSPITPPVRVTAFDALGNKATNFTGVVQVTLGHDGSPLGNAQLSGSTTAAASGGVATFADLRIDQIGTGYTLKAAFGTAA